MIIYILVGIPICTLVIALAYWRRRDKQSKTDTDKQRAAGISTAAIMFITLFSLPTHELGHLIAFNLLGIPATFAMEIRTIGPVLGIIVPYLPSTIPETIFVIAAGGVFAAIVFALLGRFWKTDCYIMATIQVFYVPFELVTWMLGIQEGGELSFLVWLLVLVMIPTLIIEKRVFDRIYDAGVLKDE